ncbi:MAG: hypothetical protein WBC05_16925, partial [Sedimentisphaerales bacterium]
HLALGRIAAGDWSYFRVLDRMLLYERRIENSLYKTINKLKTQQVIRRIEIQEVEKQREPSLRLGSGQAPTLRDEAVTRPGVKECDLKKQTQYVQDLMDAKSLMQGDYDNKSVHGEHENKANQSQLEPVKAGLKIPPAPVGAENILCSSNIQG